MDRLAHADVVQGQPGSWKDPSSGGGNPDRLPESTGCLRLEGTANGVAAHQLIKGDRQCRDNDDESAQSKQDEAAHC